MRLRPYMSIFLTRNMVTELARNTITDTSSVVNMTLRTYLCLFLYKHGNRWSEMMFEQGDIWHMYVCH